MYWPIRILIRLNGWGCKTTLNGVAYNSNKRGGNSYKIRTVFK